MTIVATAIGLDVHARSTTAYAIVAETGETKAKKFKGNVWAEIVEWSKQFPQPCSAAYESGCMGYEPFRQLNEFGLATRILAVSRLAKSPEEKRNKNDRKDAQRIAKAILSHDIEEVYVPDRECEGLRNIVRALDDAKSRVKEAKQQLAGFLQRHGFVWSERTSTGALKKPWTRDYVKWLRSIKFEDKATQLTFEYYLRAIRECDEAYKELEETARQIAQEPRWKAVVDGLQALHGCGFIMAITCAAEFGDFSRFKSGRKVSKYFGLTPTEHSSGEKNASGGISKAGNGAMRKLSIEGAWSFVRSTYDSKAVKKDQQVSQTVLTHAKKGNRRLRLRRREMLERGMNPCVANTAIASELLRWVWAIGCMIQAEEKQSAA